jgi:cell division protease FtsH
MKKNKNSNYWNKGLKGIGYGAFFIFGLFFLLHQLIDSSRRIKTISHTTFWEKIDSKQVKFVKITGQDVQGVLKDGSPFEATVGNDPGMWDKLRQQGVEVVVASTSSPLSLWYLIPILIFIALMFLIWYMSRKSCGSSGGGMSNIFSMTKSRARLFMPSSIKENFDSVAGVVEAKEELRDVVDFLRNPEKYERLGAKITRGVLLIGAPGNGKTLLARAVAGEANCPFLSVSGSEFVEVLVGVGSGRVRDLFAQARKYPACIIFIDEIDAVGRQRGAGLGGANDEREQTLNQLLTEMDGFQTSKNSIIVLAATNRADVLDPALLRPGRFDRQVHVPYPDLWSRKDILSIHMKPVIVCQEVDTEKLARGTQGFSAADLANLVNEAAIIASKEDENKVQVRHFEAARDKMLLGKELKTIRMTDDDKKITAYHEAGHALVRLLMPKHSDPLHKVTIIPRGKALGLTHCLPERDKYSLSKMEILAHITMALGGRAAEEIVFETVCTGAESDFCAATDFARKMICSYGMSDSLGFVVYGQGDGAFSYSEATAQKIDAEVQNVMDRCYRDAKKLLMDNRDKLDRLADALLEKETLFAADIYSMLDIEPRADLRFA